MAVLACPEREAVARCTARVPLCGASVAIPDSVVVDVVSTYRQSIACSRRAAAFECDTGTPAGEVYGQIRPTEGTRSNGRVATT